MQYWAVIEGDQVLNRRGCVRLGLAGAGWAALSVAGRAMAADDFEGDPFRSHPWAGMRREYLGGGPVVFDPRVEVLGPGFAEDPMNVPITVSVGSLQGVEQITVLVDRNPIRKVLDYFPVAAAPAVSFRFKLQEASPVRAAARTRDGVWHVGGTWVDSAGGGCTVPGATRKDGTWAQTLGDVSARVFPMSTAPGGDRGLSRLRVRVMHPMDTGLVAGVPAFYVNRLSVRDAADRELLRLNAFEPLSENPVFSFDFPAMSSAGLRIVGTDNNGNRIQSAVE
jgi:sulfur-oxidizing protein SoxY